MTLNPTLLFLDTETLGLDAGAPTWEVAAIRVDEYGDVEGTLNLMVEHDPGDWVATLPESFQQDYAARYDANRAMPAEHVMAQLQNIAHGAIVCGSNVGFDMARLEQLAIDLEMAPPGWHYHPEDIPTLARGWLHGRGVFPAPPWKSDFISQACGVNAKSFDRHTAMGDAQWCFALWQQVSRQS